MTKPVDEWNGDTTDPEYRAALAAARAHLRAPGGGGHAFGRALGWVVTVVGLIVGTVGMLDRNGASWVSAGEYLVLLGTILILGNRARDIR